MGLLNDLNNTPHAKRKQAEADKWYEERYAFTEKYAPECAHRNIFVAFLWFVFIVIPVAAIDIFLNDGNVD